MSIIYGIIAIVSLLLFIGYCCLVKKRDIWMLLLFISVFVVNAGYLSISISKTVEEALLANRISYLGSALLPLCMLVNIMNVCSVKYRNYIVGILLGISSVVFLIAASPGYVDWYYTAVTISVENGATTLVKEYGPLHIVYLIYLLSYFGLMVGVITYSIIKRYITSGSHATILAAVVLGNIAVWSIEQVISVEFEFLSISYIITELFLLMLFNLLQGQKAAIPVEGATQKAQLTAEQEYFTRGIQQLTKTERKIYDLYLQGNASKDVTDILGIKENTVKFHNKNIYSKLGVTSRKQLVEYAKMYDK